MILWDPEAYKAHVRERGEQLRRVSKGVKFKLADNYVADSKTKDPWEERRISSASRGSVRQKSDGAYAFGTGPREDVVDAPDDFGKAIRKWRRDAGLSKRAAGAELGVGGEVALSSLEQSKRRRIPKSDFERICAVVGFEVEE